MFCGGFFICYKLTLGDMHLVWQGVGVFFKGEALEQQFIKKHILEKKIKNADLMSESGVLTLRLF